MGRIHLVSPVNPVILSNDAGQNVTGTADFTARVALRHSLSFAFQPPTQT